MFYKYFNKKSVAQKETKINSNLGSEKQQLVEKLRKSIIRKLKKV